jgi:endonuclease/exonuclease/phosphatase family metal-dependent hydrolase
MRTLALGVVGVALVAAACTGDDDGSAGARAATSTTAPSTTTTEPETAAGELLLLSYNVAGLPQEISDVNPEAHLPLISPRLEPYDVVLTQEDFDWWTPQVEELAPDFVNYHERLRAETTHEHATEQHPGPEAVGLGEQEGRDPPFVGDGLGILSRFPFDDVERLPWEGCFGGIDTSDGGAGDCLAMKGFAVATFTLDDGAEVDMYTLHAEAGSTDEDIRLRAGNYDQLAAFMEERSAGRAVIIAGDMNLHLEPDHRRREIDEPVWLGFLDATGLTDVCDVVDCDDPGAIDKAAFRSGGGVEIEPLRQRFAVDDFLDDEGVDLSDHPPLEVRFAWTAG